MSALFTGLSASSLEQLSASKQSDFGWSIYRQAILDLARGKRLLEIGAGRSPLFTPEELNQHEIAYVANDIASRELSLLDDRYETACFDICQEIPAVLHNKFDLVCSRMVLEHVASGASYYRNIHDLLKPGGIGIAFHPVLFSPPFLLNFLLPERFSAVLLSYFFPERNDNEIPKFPARYSYCLATHRQQQRIKQHGFSQVHIIPLYGHGYFKRIPGIREIDRYISRQACKYDIRCLASFAYTLVRK